MKIDEITRNSFLSPLMAIQDIPTFDDDGEYQLEGDDGWNIYNPDEMDIPEDERETLQHWRDAVRQEGELFRQDTEKFLAAVPDEDTLKAGADMIHSLDAFAQMYSGAMQYSETLEQIAALEKTIVELEPLAKKLPGLLTSIKRLKAERDKLKDKLHKPRHGEIRKNYRLFRLIYSHAHNGRDCPVSERVWGNWCKGLHAPKNFPVDSWSDPVSLSRFVGEYDRAERTEAGTPIHGMTEEEMHRKKKQ